MEKTPEPVITKKTECPNCGCKDVYIGELADKAKADGTFDQHLEFFARVYQGTVPGPAAIEGLPLGSTIYQYFVGMDVCKDCHTLYARLIATGEGTKKAVLFKPGADLPPGLQANSSLN